MTGGKSTKEKIVKVGDSGIGELLVDQTDDGRVKLDVRLEHETVWLTQQMMADLFQTTKQNIGQHVKNIFDERELDQVSVVKNFFTTAADGKQYSTNFYNLDVIISVGYRVKSLIATRFRIWATQRLKEYIVKGFVMDDERLKNPPVAGSRQPYGKIVRLKWPTNGWVEMFRCSDGSGKRQEEYKKSCVSPIFACGECSGWLS
jgi:hypothetical protein